MRTTLTGTLALAATALSGCVTTKPLDGASVGYRLPSGNAGVKIALVLKSCAMNAIKVDVDAELVAEAGHQQRYYRIDGFDLASTRIKRGLHLSLDDEGVLTAINSETDDRSAAIAGNVLKTVATLAPLAFGMSPAANIARPVAVPSPCRPEVNAAALRAEKIEQRIRALRGELGDSGAVERARNRALARLVSELGTLRSTLLSIVIEDTIELVPPKTPPEKADAIPDTAFPIAKFLGKWFDDKQNIDELLVDQLAFRWHAEPQPETSDPVRPDRPGHKTPRECGFSLPVPDPVPVKVTLTAIVGGVAAKQVADVTVPAAQWTVPAKLCIDVGFGESRTIAVSFDKFGRKTDFAWNSEATGETVSGAIAGAAPDAVTLGGAIIGPGRLARDKSEIDRIETQQKLRKLRACEAAIAAGGDCAEE